MKDISLQFLNDAVSQSPLLYKDDIIELYTMYTAIEIDSYEIIIDATNEFFDYLIGTNAFKNSRQMQSATLAAQNVIAPKISKFSYNTFEKMFAETILELSPISPQSSHILDVGPGIIPYSSLAIAREAKNVSAMDKKFLFAVESLKAMNVNAIDMFFDENTSIEDYDFIVGKCPCSAIPHIVKKCKELNKPYFLELCNCALPNRKIYLRDDHLREAYSWKNVLPDIDPNIKFYEDYAFNLDASPEQVKNVIERIYESITPSKKFDVPATKIFLPADTIITTPKNNFNGPFNNTEDLFWYMD